jgi:hypothetical protein
MNLIFNIYYKLKSLFCNHQFVNVQTELRATIIYECDKCFRLVAFHEFTKEEQFAYRKLR